MSSQSFEDSSFITSFRLTLFLRALALSIENCYINCEFETNATVLSYLVISYLSKTTNVYNTNTDIEQKASRVNNLSLL